MKNPLTRTLKLRDETRATQQRVSTERRTRPYKHLDYIRDMRNHASAAHANQNQLSGLQVVSWLETCIKEVLSKEPEGPVIEVKKLLNSIRTEVFNETDIPPISKCIEKLPDELSRSMLRTIFGMYTDPSVAAQTRSNISLIAPSLWKISSDDARYDIGLKHATLSANGEIARKSLAHQFLTAVGGLTYLPPETLALELQVGLQNLWTAHQGFNNFYNEPPHAQVLAQFVPLSGIVPPSVQTLYLKVLLMCRIGNGHGVSVAAVETYDSLISRFSNRQIAIILKLLVEDKELSSRLQFDSCANNFRDLVIGINEKNQDKLIEHALKMVIDSSPKNIRNLRTDPKFQKAVSDLFQGKR